MFRSHVHSIIVILSKFMYPPDDLTNFKTYSIPRLILRGGVTDIKIQGNIYIYIRRIKSEVEEVNYDIMIIIILFIITL